MLCLQRLVKNMEQMKTQTVSKKTFKYYKKHFMEKKR